MYTYEYDSLGRIVRTFGNTRTTGENRFSSQYTYDVSNNVTKVVNIADGNKVSTSHSYDAENRPTKTTLNSNVNYEYTYDNLGRLNYYYLNLGSTPLLINPVYYDSERNADGDDTYLTTQIKREEIGDRGYAYTYDKVGNILTIKELKSGTSSYVDKVSYTYDSLGQLTRENNVDLNQTIVYTYDNGGNIKSKKIYAYTTGTVGALQNTINYTYDSTWKDKLMSYDGDSITYDQIGNPLTYRDNMSFTWNGRQMKSAYVVKTENNVTTTANVNYTYDADGLRTTKQVNSTLHEYEYVGGQLVYEKRGNLKFYYRYNAMGELASIKRIDANGTETSVYVVTNTRGDIEELRLASGTLVARYVYDSWGNTISILNASGSKITDTSNIAVQNPFRYRSYYYDNESGFYYLQSRYYDPVTCRFVNADDVLNVNNILGFNLYTYCNNNPINLVDTTGNHPWLIIAGVLFVCTVIGAALGYNSDEKLTSNVSKNKEKSKSNKVSLPNDTSVLQQFNKSDPLKSKKGESNTNLSNTQSTKPETPKSDILSVGDKAFNTFLGAALGLAVGGAVLSVAGVVGGVVVGSATVSIPLFGGATSAQVFVAGTLALDSVAMIVAPMVGIEMEIIEYENK